jgi:ketosteroid isomerase-like protein
VASENVELIRRGFEDFERDGVEGLLELIAPDFELTTPPNLASEPDTYRGPEGLRRYFDSFYDAMDEIGMEAHQFHDVGDRVVVEFTLHARGRSTGIETSLEAVQVWEVADGLARRLDLYPTLDEALTAARGDA